MLGAVISRSASQREMVGPAVTLRTESHLRYGNEQQMSADYDRPIEP